MQNLSLDKQEQVATSTDEYPAVIIPDHLQVTNTDCSHLSFGSFGLGAGASVQGAFVSKPATSNIEVTVAENAPSVDYSDPRYFQSYLFVYMVNLLDYL